MNTLRLRRSCFLGTFLVLVSPVHANSVKVDANTKATVYTAYGLSGTVCVEIRKEDGSPGTADFWHAGFVNVQFGYQTGSACFDFLLHLKLRTGFSKSGPVTVKVVSENTNPEAGHEDRFDKMKVY
ncbi:hypothetical protein [Oceanimonas doudoroffii]|uniref:hypothetical protein n=1 Tax=Oceanimonas doudoroffii TaxID=84158 RepID=UPI0011403426|nr:hypothetical protein [Oceanimonas doudoroffii]